MKRRLAFAAALLAMLLFAGCSVETAQTLYRVPKRSQAQQILAQAQESAMLGRTYAQSGTQRIFPVNLDGYGQLEYVILARKESQLQILVLADRGKGYELSQVVDCPGTAFGRADWGQESVIWLLDSQGCLEGRVSFFYSDGAAKLCSLAWAKCLDASAQLYRLEWESGEAAIVQYPQGWLLKLPQAWAGDVVVEANPWEYDFYLPRNGEKVKMFSIFCFTGADRETQATAQNRFIIGRSTTQVYAAYLEVASGTIALSQEDLRSAFSVLDPAET